MFWSKQTMYNVVSTPSTETDKLGSLKKGSEFDLKMPHSHTTGQPMHSSEDLQNAWQPQDRSTQWSKHSSLSSARALQKESMTVWFVIVAFHGLTMKCHNYRSTNGTIIKRNRYRHDAIKVKQSALSDLFLSKIIAFVRRLDPRDLNLLAQQSHCHTAHRSWSNGLMKMSTVIFRVWTHSLDNLNTCIKCLNNFHPYT